MIMLTKFTNSATKINQKQLEKWTANKKLLEVYMESAVESTKKLKSI